MVAFAACKKKGCTDPGATNYDPEAKKYDGSCDYSDFSRQAMLQNIGKNIIIPNYKTLVDKSTELNDAVTNFAGSPSTVNLTTVQQAWKTANLAWQNCKMFEFGPAEDEAMRANLNTYPTDSAQIENNISSGSYDLNSFTTAEEKGFPALDLLLFGIGENNDSIVNKYTIAPNATKRMDYLKDVSAHIKAKAETVYNAWIEEDGNYIQTFVEATGTDVGSSLGMLVNQLNFDYELIKNAKIGIPLGKKTLWQPLPEHVEAYYSGVSVELATANIEAIEHLYLGSTGLGLDDHLNAVDAQYNGGTLDEAIKSQLTKAINELKNVPDPLSETIISNPSVVDDAYTELQAQVVLFKTDMPSVLGVLITYQDNDGD